MKLPKGKLRDKARLAKDKKRLNKWAKNKTAKHADNAAKEIGISKKRLKNAVESLDNEEQEPAGGAPE